MVLRVLCDRLVRTQKGEAHLYSTLSTHKKIKRPSKRYEIYHRLGLFRMGENAGLFHEQGLVIERLETPLTRFHNMSAASDWVCVCERG